MNWESFLQAYDILQSQQLLIGKMEDGYVKGYITISYPGLLFTSIPYDAGWTAYVDGEKYEIDKVGNAFIALKLAAGDHVIEFKYFSTGSETRTDPYLCMLAAVWLPVWKKTVSEPEGGERIRQEKTQNTECRHK